MPCFHLHTLSEEKQPVRPHLPPSESVSRPDPLEQSCIIRKWITTGNSCLYYFLLGWAWKQGMPAPSAMAMQLSGLWHRLPCTQLEGQVCVLVVSGRGEADVCGCTSSAWGMGSFGSWGMEMLDGTGMGPRRWESQPGCWHPLVPGTSAEGP